MDLRVGTKVRFHEPYRPPQVYGGAPHNIWTGVLRPRAVRRFHHTMGRGVEIGAGKLTWRLARGHSHLTPNSDRSASAAYLLFGAATPQAPAQPSEVLLIAAPLCGVDRVIRAKRHSHRLPLWCAEDT
jgi:hypothetical protein